MRLLDSLLAEGDSLVIDGAMATELERRGCDLHDRLWSAKVLLERPELIRQVHQDYFLAGADCAISASYQASFAGFAARGIEADAAAALMRLAVQLAAEARDAVWADADYRAHRSRPIVAASIGPYGAVLADGSEYRGDYAIDEDALLAWHRPRMAVLADAGADLLACETIPCLAEARALIRLLSEFPQARAWVSFSARDGAHTCHGESIADCAALLDAAPQVVAIGVNCTAPQHIASLVRAIRSGTGKPIVVYPNSGETYAAGGGGWMGDASHVPFAAQAKEWHAAGARLIGGCCRTTPADIAALAAWLRPPGRRYLRESNP